MRRPLSLAAALAVVAIGSPAMAQVIDTAGQRLDIAGTAPAACVINAPTASNARNATFSVSGNSTVRVDYGVLVDQNTALTQASAIDIRLPMVCNAPGRIVVRSENRGLRPAGNQRGSGGFIDVVDIDVGVRWLGQSASLTTMQGGGMLENSQPARGDLEVALNTRAGQGPLVAGNYSDTIVIEFQLAM